MATGNESAIARGQAVRCCVMSAPGETPCGKPATHVVTFIDDDMTPACEACAIWLQQTAESHGSRVRVRLA